MKQEKTLIHDFTEGPILSQLFRFGSPFILSSYAPVAVLCFLGAGLRSPAIAFVNGIGATSMNYIMGIMDGVVMRIGLAWLLGGALNFGITGYWYGSAIAGFTFFVVGAPYYWSGIWKKRLPSHTA